MAGIDQIRRVYGTESKKVSSKLSFQIGETFSARIADSSEDEGEVTLQLSDGWRLPAKLEKPIDFSLKGQLKFQVIGQQDGKLILKLADSNTKDSSSEADSLVNILSENNLSSEEYGLLEKMLKHGIALNKENISKIKSLADFMAKISSNSSEEDLFIDKYILSKAMPENSEKGATVKELLKDFFSKLKSIEIDDVLTMMENNIELNSENIESFKRVFKESSGLYNSLAETGQMLGRELSESFERLLKSTIIDQRNIEESEESNKNESEMNIEENGEVTSSEDRQNIRVSENTISRPGKKEDKVSGNFVSSIEGKEVKDLDSSVLNEEGRNTKVSGGSVVIDDGDGKKALSNSEPRIDEKDIKNINMDVTKLIEEDVEVFEGSIKKTIKEDIGKQDSIDTDAEVQDGNQAANYRNITENTRSAYKGKGINEKPVTKLEILKSLAGESNEIKDLVKDIFINEKTNLDSSTINKIESVINGADDIDILSNLKTLLRSELGFSDKGLKSLEDVFLKNRGEDVLNAVKALVKDESFGNIQENNLIQSEINKKTEEMKSVIKNLFTMKNGFESETVDKIVELLKPSINDIKVFNTISNQYYYMDVPVNLNSKDYPCKLIIKDNRSAGKKIDSKNISMVVSIRTASLGTVDSFIKVRDNNMNIDVKCDDKWISPLESSKDKLISNLSTLGYSIGITFTKREKEVDITSCREFFNDSSFNNLDIKV